MSSKGEFFVLNSEIVAGGKDNPIVVKSANASGSTERKSLADISNLPHKPKQSTLDKMSQNIPASTKEYINELKKENMTLMKLLADRNKIIELSGIELRKLRVNLQKTQLQNLQLAQSNSQLLSELTSGKDRLKLLQHEVGCKKGLLVAKGLELKEKTQPRPPQKVDKEVDTHKCDETLVSSETVRDNKQPCNMKKRQQSKSLGPSTVNQLEVKKADSKRLCVRRQSARFKSEESKPADLFEVDTTRIAAGPLHDDQMQEDVLSSMGLSVEKEDKISDNKKRIRVRRQSARFKSEEPKPAEDLFEVDSTRLGAGPIHDQTQEGVSNSTCLSVKTEDEEGKSDPPSNQGQDIGRPSIGRPARQAAKRVNSYKEVPLNVKMRRTG